MKKQKRVVPKVQLEFAEDLSRRLTDLSMTAKKLSREIKRISGGSYTISEAKLSRLRNLESVPSIVDAFWIDQVVGLRLETRVSNGFRSAMKFLTFSREKKAGPQAEEILA